MDTPALPSQFTERLTALLGPESSAKVQQTFATGHPTTFRVNTLKADPTKVAADLASAGFELQPANFYPAAFILQNKSLGELSEQPAYKNGEIYVQNFSSMLPPLILDPQPGDKVADLAAAPGSKTTQLAALMQNDGLILANDASTIRLYKLKANLEQQGATCVHTSRGLAELMWRKHSSQFDHCLVDVPCSMEGRIRLDRPKTFEKWSLKSIKQLAKRQRQMLRSAVSMTKPGGTIVYSTCTLAPEENEAVVDWALQKSEGAVVVEQIQLSGVPFSAGITEWEGVQFDQQVARTSRVLPDGVFEGFYVALLRRIL